MAFFTATTLAVASLATAAIGTGLAVYGQMQQAQTAKAAGAYNAKLAEQQALQTEMDSRESIKRRRAQNKRFLGSQRSAIAKSGVTIEGSPLEVMAETAGILELDALDASRQARQRAAGLRAEGAMARFTGGRQATAAYIGAGSSLLSGAAGITGDAYQFHQSGAL